MVCVRRLRGAGVLGWLTVVGWLAAGEAAGQTGVWTSGGPVGGSIYCLAADPSLPTTLYAGTNVGVHKSLDGGSNWTSASAALPVERYQTIAIDPSNTSTLYAGTLTPNGVPSVGIFKSTDGGASWTAINNGLVDPITLSAPLDVEALAVHPHNSSTLLAGARFSEIFKSVDGGASWVPKTVGGSTIALEVSAFQYDPTDPSIIYAASTQGLLLSTDAGENWTPYGDASVPFYSITADNASVPTLYVGNITGYGVLKSTDRGAHWTQINGNLPPVSTSSGLIWPLIRSVVVDPSQPSTLYIATSGNGIFRSTDGGTTWIPASSGMRSAYVSCLSISPSPPERFYAGTLGGGIYRSANNALTWTQASAGIHLSLVSGLLADPSQSGTVYASVFDGVQKSVDGGESWQPAENGLPVIPVAAIAHAGTALFVGTLGQGLFRSSDGAASWGAGGSGLADSYASSLAVDPSNPSVLYAGTGHPSTSQPQMVYKSTDAGSTWAATSLAASSSIDFLAVNPGKASQIVAISRGASSYSQSMNGGSTWTTVTPSASCGGVNTILFDGATTYLGGTSGVCRSSDGGATWSLAAVAVSASVRALLLDPTNPGVLYAGATPAVPHDTGGTGGVFSSADGGQTWQAVGSGLSGVSVTSLAIDSIGRTLYAGTSGNGVGAYSFVPTQRLPVEPPSVGNHETRTVNPR
jgi:photosystem II stability/assembly factor-like uncharacterized protein